VTVSDLRDETALAASLAELDGLPFQRALGGHHAGLFEEADIVVVNPAVPSDSPWLQHAIDAGCVLTSEVNLALQLTRHVPTIAITGTHGKSTTAAWTAHLLESLPGRTVLAGNLGGSLLEACDQLTSEDQLVVELSSFQLEQLSAPAGWPWVAIVTCLRPDHLDRHGDFASYAAAKRRLLDQQDERGLILMPAEEASLDDFARAASGRIRRLSPNQIDWQAWQLEPAALADGDAPYQLAAFQFAAHAAMELGLAPSALQHASRGFSGLPHRMQVVHAENGCCWIDNGVATHPEPTCAALDHLGDPIDLVVGGYDKGIALGSLPVAAQKCRSIHLFGAGGRRLQEALAADIPSSLHPDCSSAIRSALSQQAEAPGTLLFSPSFASFDEFANFRERALLFQDLCQTFVEKDRKTAGDTSPAAY